MEWGTVELWQNVQPGLDIMSVMDGSRSGQAGSSSAQTGSRSGYTGSRSGSRCGQTVCHPTSI